MRSLIATLKPVLHLPAGILAAIVAMTVCAVVALSSPIPSPSLRSRGVAAAPVAVTASGSPQIDRVADARAYLRQTAFAGGSMTILGNDASIACLHPQFALNLAATIRDARAHGFPGAGVFSGCRPPRLGIGGFRDKRNSLHGVGLAADIHGIGSPCSAQAKRFHRIAALHGVYGAYGPCNRAEFNHMQGTRIRQTTPALRATFTKAGDIAPDLEKMWRLASAVVIMAGQPVTNVHAGKAHPATRHAVKRRPVKRIRVAGRNRRHRIHAVRRSGKPAQRRDTWAWDTPRQWDTPTRTWSASARRARISNARTPGARFRAWRT